MTGGLAVMASYTMSKTLDNCSGLYDWQDYGYTGVQNHYALRAERSVAGFDIAHNLAYSFIWQLPAGKGRRFGNRSGWFDAMLGGWNVSKLSTVRSGMPLVLGTQGNLTGSPGGGSCPNRTRDVALSGEQRGVQRWFDASGFSLPDAYTFGNTSRTEPRLRGPGDVDLDIMLAKDFGLSEKRQLQLRSEFFNALNHFNPGMPNTSIGNRAVGQITSGNAGRTVQLSLRLYY